MIVPGSALPVDPSVLKQDNAQAPSPSQLLMAAAQMHQMGRLAIPDTDDTTPSPKPIRAPLAKAAYGHRPADRSGRR